MNTPHSVISDWTWFLIEHCNRVTNTLTGSADTGDMAGGLMAWWQILTFKVRRLVTYQDAQMVLTLKMTRILNSVWVHFYTNPLTGICHSLVHCLHDTCWLNGIKLASSAQVRSWCVPFSFRPVLTLNELQVERNWLYSEECRLLGCDADVSEGCSASIIRVKWISELGATLAVTSNYISLFLHNVLQLLVAANIPSLLVHVTLMMQATHSSERSAFFIVTTVRTSDLM
jgi:hypothetical protein